MNIPFGNLCLVGGSGCGKSTFAIKLSYQWKQLKDEIKNLYITNINDHTQDVPKSFTQLELNQIFDSKTKSTLIRDCVLIIEDLISITKPMERVLLYLLNYSARRNNINVICITHSFKKTNLLQIVQHIGVIIFFGKSMASCDSFKVINLKTYVITSHTFQI